MPHKTTAGDKPLSPINKLPRALPRIDRAALATSLRKLHPVIYEATIDGAVRYCTTYDLALYFAEGARDVRIVRVNSAYVSNTNMIGMYFARVNKRDDV